MPTDLEYLINGDSTYLPCDLDVALLDRQNMIEAGQRNLIGRKQLQFWGTRAHVRDKDGNSLIEGET